MSILQTLKGQRLGEKFIHLNKASGNNKIEVNYYTCSLNKLRRALEQAQGNGK